jgi:hypothetical protein
MTDFYFLKIGCGSTTGNAAGIVTDKSDQIHSCLALVSQSIRDLLCRHQRIFRRANILLPASQLVEAIKGGRDNEGNLIRKSTFLN